MNVLESELWGLKEPRDEVLAALELSYKQPRDEVLAALELSYKRMPVQLKRCFLCLSLFPKDYKIYVSEVSRLWKLHDLLDSDGSDNECEIAKFYLKDLAQRSILLMLAFLLGKSSTELKGIPVMNNVYEYEVNEINHSKDTRFTWKTPSI